MVSGQSFLELLEWHPRDVDTMQEIYEDIASERRLEAARAHTAKMMGG